MIVRARHRITILTSRFVYDEHHLCDGKPTTTVGGTRQHRIVASGVGHY